MLSLELNDSLLSPHLKWNVQWGIEPGVVHWLQGPNGVGKSSLFEELKCQWASIAPEVKLGFTDQEPFAPFQDLSVEKVFDILWEVAPERRLGPSWRELPIWDDESRALLNRSVRLLSGGENQWVKILMMRSLKSDVWLLDEPFQFLDVQRRNELKFCLSQWLEAGKFLIFSHHGSAPLERYLSWKLCDSDQGLMVKKAEML